MITFHPVDLTAAAQAAADLLRGGDEGRMRAMGGTAFTLCRDGARCGSIIVGMVQDGFGHDLVVFAAKGEGGGLTEAMDEFVVELARAAGLDGVRCFTNRPGLVRKLERLRWYQPTKMMRVEV